MAYRVDVPGVRQGLCVSVLALVAAGFAGCSSDVTRFNESPFSSASSSPPPSAEVTGSISRGPAAPSGTIERQPLPQPQAALPAPPPKQQSSTGTAAGAGGMASYRPPQASAEVTGSITPPPPARTAAPAPAAKATVVTLAPGETLASLSRRHGVPIAAIIKANGITSPNDVKIGQKIIIPSGKTAAVTAAQPQAAPASVPATPSYGGFHIAGPGDTLVKVAQRYRVSVADLAKANGIVPHAQIKLGDRLAIPAQTSSKQPAPEKRAELPPAPAPQQVAAAEPTHTANVASPTENPEAEAKRETGGSVFRWPVRGRIVTAFGAKPNGQQNDGINIAVPEGTPVKAAEDGEVAYAGNELKGYGNLILVRHPNGFVTAYAHASELLVKRGDKVKRGQVIAKSGRTGNVSAPQLHFEIRKGSTPVDPTPYLGA
jgi:murein DD-endopeptidase MepM/ murein hydrolase activator NlpD